LSSQFFFLSKVSFLHRKIQEEMNMTMTEVREEKDRVEREARARKQLETALKVTGTHF